MIHRIALTFAAIAAAACHHPAAPDSVDQSGNTANTATVLFELDAPLCSSTIPVEFMIDNQVVGVDTFRVHLANEHTKSRSFVTTAGRHVLSARTSWGYTWEGRTVMLSAGQVVTDSLPFYCS